MVIGSILILGGTTEGCKAAEILDSSGNGFYYSTKEGEKDILLHNGSLLRGAMSVDEMSRFCKDHNISVLVDAAHPFASALHATVKEVSDRLALPVVRYERRYPRTAGWDRIVWIDDYDNAVSYIKTDGIKKILVLTGVQSAAKLMPMFKEAGIDAYFRILNRDSSIDKAREAGVPDDRIVFYDEDGDDRQLFKAISPDAILLKDSGLSGKFPQKTDLAVNSGIKVYAIRRPKLPDGFITIDGPHGLRLEIERLLPEFFPLRTGITTGTCATAGAIGGALNLFGMMECGRHVVGVVLPDGETVNIPVEVKDDCTTVIKDAGSDPDVTDGMQIDVEVTEIYDAPDTIMIDGGKGVGRVTLPGLGINVGDAAINTVPRRMIEDNLRLILPERLKKTGLRVVISCPDGAERSARTFNPRLGIVDGISIIGTSGIVHPFSADAFVESIRKSIAVAKATGCDVIALNSGARSERAVRSFLPDIPSQAFVHYGNFIGETLQVCSEEKVASIVMGLMIGKAVKLAEGHLNTHSHNVTMNRDFIGEVLDNIGASEKMVNDAKRLNLARELLQILPQHILQMFSAEILRLCYGHCKTIVPDTELKLLLIDDSLNIIATYPQ